MDENEKLKIRLYKLSSFLIDSFVAARRTVSVNALIAKRTLARIFPASANLLKRRNRSLYNAIEAYLSFYPSFGRGYICVSFV